VFDQSRLAANESIRLVNITPCGQTNLGLVQTTCYDGYAYI
jgi:hypothetical protein